MEKFEHGIDLLRIAILRFTNKFVDDDDNNIDENGCQ